MRVGVSMAEGSRGSILARPSVTVYAALVSIAPVAPILAGAAALANRSGRWPLWIGIAAVLVFVFIRARRVRFELDAERLAITNYWRSYVFDWSQVDRVGMSGGVFPAVAFRLKDGAVRRVQASSFSPRLREAGLSLARQYAPAGIEINR